MKNESQKKGNNLNMFSNMDPNLSFAEASISQRIEENLTENELKSNESESRDFTNAETSDTNLHFILNDDSNSSGSDHHYSLGVDSYSDISGSLDISHSSRKRKHEDRLDLEACFQWA